jgi:predicted amidohydrolase
VPLIRIATVQQNCPKGEVAQNLAATTAYIRDTAADIICFPEMSLTGYLDPVAQADAMLTLDSPEVRDFCALTADRPVTAVAGLVERNPHGRPFITQIVATGGKLLGAYRKVNVAPDETESFSTGSDTPVFFGAGIRFGIAVCYDVGHPELFDAYAQAGAQLVVLAAAPGLYGDQASRDWDSGFQWWRTGCRTHLAKSARRNGLWIAVATQAGRTVDEDFPGGGYLFNPDGEVIAETADHTEQILIATADMAG